MKASKLKKLVGADLRRLLPDNPDVSGFQLWSKLFHPRFVPVLHIRLSQYFYHSRILRPLSFIFSLINHIMFGIEVTPRCCIGPGLLLPHTSGVVIGAIEIGDNVTIFQGVTLGSKYFDIDFTPTSRPVLEDGVVIGAGAKVLGGIRIGRNAVVAANSLVTESIPEGGYAIGVPAVVTVS